MADTDAGVLSGCMSIQPMPLADPSGLRKHGLLESYLARHGELVTATFIAWNVLTRSGVQMVWSSRALRARFLMMRRNGRATFSNQGINLWWKLHREVKEWRDWTEVGRGQSLIKSNLDWAGEIPSRRMS